MALPKKIYKLKGVIQHYSWGGFDFIPELLNIKNKEQKPYAEYWLGAHPNHSSFTDEGLLSDLIQNNLVEMLGENVAKKFSSLPYLFKVLDVRQMLSIQVHPGIESGIIGFREENKKGIPLNAFNRNYKDQNHKPELMVALSDFWLLHGFKKENDLKKILETIPEFNFLKKTFDEKSYKGLYEEVMQMDQQKVNEILNPLVQRIVPKYQNNLLQKNEEDFWAARAFLTFCKNENYDRGIFSIYFFNLLHLKKGEGVFQPAGLPHAYLEGQNAEVMANSDNVLRAGLTDKYIDVVELMKHVHCKATLPNILKPSNQKHKIFLTPAEEFELHEYEMKEGEEELVKTKCAEIWLVIEGKIMIERFQLQKGEALFISANAETFFKVLEDVELFRVSVPLE